VKLAVRITANAKKSEIIGEIDGTLRIKIAAPAVDGKANAELIRFLAQHFKVPRSRVHILRGETARMKMVEIEP
jgi:uncharacterized protein (TIGR00251 family)